MTTTNGIISSYQKNTFSEDHIRMFKYLILKDLYNLSNRGLVQRAHTDLAFKYFLDLVAEVDVIDATTPIKILRERSKNLRKKMCTVDENCKDDLPEKYIGTELAQEVKYTHDLIIVLDAKSMAMLPAIAEASELLIESVDEDTMKSQSLGDATARIGYKSADDAFFGYKSHIAMTDESIICAVEVTVGNDADGNHFITRKNKIKWDGNRNYFGGCCLVRKNSH